MNPPTSAASAAQQRGVNRVPRSVTSPQAVHIDLRLLDYASPVDSNLVCPICHCPFIIPRRLDCDHTFCQHCLVFTFLGQSNDQKTCPSCRSPVDSVHGTALPRFFISMMDDLIVKCPFHSAGCEIQLRRGHVQDHVDLYCEYAEIKCPDPACDLTVARRFRSDHCLHHEVTCEHCQGKLIERDLELHSKHECNGLKSTCLDCGDEIFHSILDKHDLNCPEASISCSAISLGCNFHSKRPEALQHMAACPLALLLPTLKAMNSRMDDQDHALKIIQRRNATLEHGLTTIQGILGTSTAALLDNGDVPHSIANTSTMMIPPTSPGTRDAPPFDSATHHLLSLHEALREEVDRVSATVSELDARSSMMIMNESLRAKEDMAHANAVIGSMRMQLQWLTSARLQAQPRSPMRGNIMGASTNQGDDTSQLNGREGQPIRRLSDSSRQDTKL